MYLFLVFFLLCFQTTHITGAKLAPETTGYHNHQTAANVCPITARFLAVRRPLHPTIATSILRFTGTFTSLGLVDLLKLLPLLGG